MQPAARLSAAIDILDDYLGGGPLEKVLTNWARRSRFAGSKDRAAIRDIVFDCVRCRKSFAAHGGSETGRGLVIGWATANHDLEDAQDLFSGVGHAPQPMSEAEISAFDRAPDLDWSACHDMPAWLRPTLEASLTTKLDETCQTLKARAPVFVRVNLRKATRDQARDRLSVEGIETRDHETVDTALEVVENPRKLVSSTAYKEGLIELQDATAQLICKTLPEAHEMLDYCAGGGGKVLAYGALHEAELFAHDANTARLVDLPERANRAGLNVKLLTKQACVAHAPFDLVVCDVPCSGSGSWRRTPEGKWSLTDQKLSDLHQTQASILDEAAGLVRSGGTLAYVTCSILEAENTHQCQLLTERNSSFRLSHEQQHCPDTSGDGFYVAHLTRL